MVGQKKEISLKRLISNVCDPAGARTQDPNIKSVVLYLLSYRVYRFCDLRVQKYTFFFNSQEEIEKNFL